jgi:multidrug resistance efflux pump
MSVAPILITLGTVAVAVLLAWAMWQVYMAAPWTRDGTVRAYVVTMAPEVAGRIVKLPVADNQFVHKGDDRFEIDPADYRIALEQAQAQAQRDGAALDYARANVVRKASFAKEGWSRRISTSCLLKQSLMAELKPPAEVVHELSG